MKVYTDAEYDRLYEETLSYEQIETNIRGFERVMAAKNQWDEIQYCYANLSSGIRLEVADRQILIDCNRLREFCGRQYFVAKFYLSGYHSVISPNTEGVPAEYAEKKRQSYLFHLPYLKEIEQYWASDRVQRLRIEVDLDIIRRFVSELDTIPRQLQGLVEDENPQQFYSPIGDMTSQMQTIVRQIWQHPYQGTIARMYLEGKVLELLAMQFAQLTELKPNTVRATLKRKSIDRIYQAKEILATSLENPPSILELTQQVGLCEQTLRRGFRELYGTTIVGYLTLLRMEQAEKLLRERELSISEIANLVGYSHLGNFSVAFKRQFGITPSQCIAGKKLP